MLFRCHYNGICNPNINDVKADSLNIFLLSSALICFSLSLDGLDLDLAGLDLDLVNLDLAGLDLDLVDLFLLFTPEFNFFGGIKNIYYSIVGLSYIYKNIFLYKLVIMALYISIIIICVMMLCITVNTINTVDSDDDEKYVGAPNEHERNIIVNGIISNKKYFNKINGNFENASSIIPGLDIVMYNDSIELIHKGASGRELKEKLFI
jgi:uncharacterized membrane protein